MIQRLIFSVIFLLFAFTGNMGFSQGYDVGFPIIVRIDLDKDGIFENADAVIDLIDPADPKKEGYGTVKVFTVKTSTKKNCNDFKYSYKKITMQKDWVGILKNDPDVKVGPADLQRYWDWVYAGYKRESELDFSKNCHGYSLGVGDWPNSAKQIMMVGPYPKELKLKQCYLPSAIKDAKIAADLDADHTIIVVGAECDAKKDDDDDAPVSGTGSSDTEMPTGTDTPDQIEPTVDVGVAVPKVSVIVESREQFRESGVYSQKATCPETVDLKLAKLHFKLKLKFYKPNDGK